MNLLSLPDEMLANVFKFFKFETIVLLRKMNVRIDAVTLRYGINKPKIYSFSPYQNVVHLTIKTIDIQADCKNAIFPESYLSRQLKMESSNYFGMIEWLKKIRDVQRFCFHDREIDDTFLYLLVSIKHKNRTSLVFYLCNFKLSLEDMEKILSRFRSVRIITSTKNTILNENFASDKVMCSLLSYAEIILIPYDNNVFLPAVTDKTLIELQRYLPNCFMLRLSRANFTIPEIIRTIKVAVQNRDCFKLEWYFGQMHVETREELNRIIENFRNIEGITIDEMTSIACVRFKGQYHRILWSINCF